MNYHGLQVPGTADPFDEWFEEGDGTQIDDYDVFDEVDEEDRPDYE